jgi:hypothetical protein
LPSLTHPYIGYQSGSSFVFLGSLETPYDTNKI